MAKKQKILPPSTFSKIKHTLTKRSFIGAFIFAIALWSYASLNGEYVTLVKVPLSTVLPENRALEEPLPQEISVKVEGTGWNLFNLNFLKSSAKCQIDLSDKMISDSIYRINRTDIITSITGLNKFEPRDVYPDNMLLKTGQISEYEVPVIGNLELNTYPNYKIVGDIEIKPDKIKIRGNEKLVKNINFWDTEYIRYEELNSDISFKVPLKDTLSGIIDLSRDQVEINVKIEQMAELRIDDIEISYKGGKPGISQIIYPRTASIVIQGGVNQLQNISRDKVMIYLNYNDLLNDSTGLIKTHADVPDQIKLLKIEPEYVYHYIEFINRSLANY